MAKAQQQKKWPVTPYPTITYTAPNTGQALYLSGTALTSLVANTRT